jgi:hypothetical protein
MLWYKHTDSSPWLLVRDIDHLTKAIQELIMAHEALLIAQAQEQNDMGTLNTSQSPLFSPAGLASQKLRCDAIINFMS